MSGPWWRRSLWRSPRRRYGRLACGRANWRDRRLRALADVAFDGLILAWAGTIIATNPALARLMGIGAVWFEHRPLGALFDAAARQGGCQPTEATLILPDGGRHPAEVARRAVEGSPEEVVAIRDLLAQKATRTQIERLTHSDLPTGVGNGRRWRRSSAR